MTVEVPTIFLVIPVIVIVLIVWMWATWRWVFGPLQRWLEAKIKINKEDNV